MKNIFFNIVGFVFFLLIAALMWYVFCYNIHFSITHIKDMIGVAISCTSMLITAYFAVLAVNAYGHVKDIEKTRDNIENANAEIKKIKDKIRNIEDEAGKTLNELKNIKNSFELEIFRSVYKTPTTLNEDTKYSYILNLGNLGDDSDIEHLNAISMSSENSVKIREVAKWASEQLSQKYHNVLFEDREKKREKLSRIKDFIKFFKF